MFDEKTSGSGIDILVDFINEKYLKEFVSEGGSKIKFVTGKSGCGKTFFLDKLYHLAEEEGYKAVSFSANDIWLFDFKEIYVEILRQVDIDDCLKKCADKIIISMGDNPDEIAEGMNYMDYLSQKKMADPLMRRTIYMALKEMFLDNALLDNNFALAVSMLTGSMLGHPALEKQNQELLLGYLMGDKTIKLSLLRGLGLSPTKITKLNARHMLRSLAEIVRLSGYKGILVCIDDMEILLNKSGLDQIRYTKVRREDTYESIRQLIDDIDSMKNLMFMFGFDRSLLDDEKLGIKSYQALWMRIQNEIISKNYNKFSDMIDIDKFSQQYYDINTLVNMSRNLKPSLLKNEISEAEAGFILERAKVGNTGVPVLIKQILNGELSIDGGDSDV